MMDILDKYSYTAWAIILIIILLVVIYFIKKIVEDTIIKIKKYKKQKKEKEEKQKIIYKDKILNTYQDSGLQPPYFRELSKNLNIDPASSKEVLMHLVEGGHLVKAKEDLYFHASAIEDLKDKLVAFLETRGEITTPQFKEMTGVSRKYVIPLAEFFDAKNVTLRVGDVRKLRRK